MDQRVLFALIGALPGLLPAILLYLQRKKEIAANLPLGAFTATSAVEASIRTELQTRIESLKVDIRELKSENKELQARVFELEKTNLEISAAWNKKEK